jgi:hypothetical protein
VSKWIYFLFINLMLMPTVVFGHARLKNTVLADGQVFTPRNTNDGIKAGPCGGVARTAGVTLRPGQALTVNWEETVNHPGFFRIYFSSANDANFQLLGEMVDNANGALPHQFNMTVNLPNVTCDACTIQLIQYMTESNPPSLYYSCADIILNNNVVAPNPAPSSSGSGNNSNPTSSGDNTTTSAKDILRACGGGTKVSSINASLSFALLLPVAGLLRRRKK